MMINFASVPKCYLITGYTDLRKGIDGLAAILTGKYGLNLFEEAIFLFCGRRCDRFKALYFDSEGFFLLYKRYDQGRLNCPRKADSVEVLSPKQVDWLFDGLSIYQKQKIQPAKIGALT